MSEPVNFNPLEPQPLLIVISGLPGVGKDSVVKRMMQCDPSFHFVVTVNTRPPRLGEVDGVDYIFLSEEQYFRMKERGELLESARVYNEYKGVPRKQVEAALYELKLLAPLAKPAVIKACLAVVMPEGKLSIVQAELMRAICAALDTPLPPILDTLAEETTQ